MQYARTILRANQRLRSSYFVLHLDPVPALAATKPGQFVMLRGDWGADPLLPRALSLMGVGTQGESRVLVKTVGKASARLESTPPGAPMDVLGPLGVPFPAPEPGRTDILVAGGVGLAPLMMQLEAYPEAVPQSEFCYGARTAEDLVLVPEIERTGVNLALSTDDGTRGSRGNVVQLLDARIEALGRSSPRLLACGPSAMLDAVRSLCARRDLEAYLSLEGEMACGIGACLGCAVAAKRKPFLYVCKDGPVLRADELG